MVCVLVCVYLIFGCFAGEGGEGEGRIASPVRRHLHYENAVWKRYHRIESTSKAEAEMHSFLYD